MTVSPKPNRRIITAAVCVLAFCLLTFGVWLTGNYLGRNPAQDAAKPVEDAFIKTGAAKLCAATDRGHGPDNFRPWYKSYFGINGDQATAYNAINQAAKTAGYSLHHATPTDRGPVEVTDKYLENWYYDNTSKKDITLFITLNDQSNNDVCDRVSLIDASHTVVTMEVQLPYTN